MSSQEWIVGEGATAIGPLTTAQLRALAAAGKITPESLVRTTEMTSSVPARRVKGLFTAAPVTAAIALPTLPPPPTDIRKPDELPPPVTFQSENVADTALPAIPPSPPTTPDYQAIGVPEGETLFKESRPGPGDGTRPRPATSRIPAPLASLPRLRPPPPPVIELSTPRWIDLWPLLTLTLGVGWIGGGLLADGRYFTPNSFLLIMILMLASVAMASIAFLHWLRPRQVPWGTAIGACAFTAIGGVLLLLFLQWTAFSLTWRIPLWLGKLSLILLIPKLIGLAYMLTESSNLFLRWIGYVAGVGICEETVKLLPLVYLIVYQAHKRMGIHTFMAIGFASGIGFGINEALYLYNPWNEAPTATSNLIRWFCCVPSHALWTATCAGFLWKWQAQFDIGDTFWDKAWVVVKAAGAMALLHGTYDTVCSYGLVAAALMDVVTFPVLAWLMVHFTINESDPQSAIEQPYLQSVRRPSLMAGGLVAAGLIASLAMLGSVDEKTWLPIYLRAQVLGPYRPYIAGVDPVGLSSDSEHPNPLTVHFGLDLSSGIENAQDAGIVGSLNNTGDSDLKALKVTCIDIKGHETSFDIDTLAAHASLELDLNWTFEPHEKLSVSWEGHDEPVRFSLP